MHKSAPSSIVLVSSDKVFFKISFLPRVVTGQHPSLEIGNYDTSVVHSSMAESGHST